MSEFFSEKIGKNLKLQTFFSFVKEIYRRYICKNKLNFVKNLFSYIIKFFFSENIQI